MSRETTKEFLIISREVSQYPASRAGSCTRH